MRELTSCRAVYDYYGHGETYDKLHTANQANRAKWSPYIPSTSFKFIVSGYNYKIPQRRQREVIESFAYMDFLGPIDMKSPEIVLSCFEECEDSNHPGARGQLTFVGR